MDVLGFTEARAKLGAVLKAVVADHNPVVVAHPKGGAVVLVSLSDWRALEETVRLRSSPSNG
jgi:antitoxin YefM